MANETTTINEFPFKVGDKVLDGAGIGYEIIKISDEWVRYKIYNTKCSDRYSMRKQEFPKCFYKFESTPTDFQSEIIKAVLAERKRQDFIHGDYNDSFEGIAVIAEEFGELSQAIIDTKYGGKDGGEDNITKEAIQIMASVLKLLEHRNCELKEK